MARGLLAVLALLATALDELATSLLGLPALAPRLREVRRTIAETYSDGVHDVHPADHIDEVPDDEGGGR